MRTARAEPCPDRHDEHDQGAYAEHHRRQGSPEARESETDLDRRFTAPQVGSDADGKVEQHHHEKPTAEAPCYSQM